VLSEGWDQPSVKYLAVARPTQSVTKFLQMCGRVLRPWESITPIIVDHGRNVDRHGLPHEDREWDLLEGCKPHQDRAKLRVCPQCYAYVVENPCELCKHLAPPSPRKAIVADLRALLKERTNDDPRLAYFERQVEASRTKGFKPGYAGAKYKEKFGEWPPWSWSQKVKEVFAKDEAWQRRQMAREKEREFWKAHDRQRGDMVECVDDGDDGSLGALVK
jgi:superfamily II DNA or RNA helicase